MDELTIIVVMEMGIRKFDLKTEDGSVNINCIYDAGCVYLNHGAEPSSD